MKLAPIEAVHDRLQASFAGHQEALVAAVADRAARPRAQKLWDAFAALLRAHIRFEEEQLLPLFEDRVEPAPRGCDAALLRAEHAKLGRQLATLDQAVRQHLRRSADQPEALLTLIEQQRGLRELLAHHDQRERAAFFPNLAEVLSEDELDFLLAASRAAHPEEPA